MSRIFVRNGRDNGSFLCLLQKVPDTARKQIEHLEPQGRPLHLRKGGGLAANL